MVGCWGWRRRNNALARRLGTKAFGANSATAGTAPSAGPRNRWLKPLAKARSVRSGTVPAGIATGNQAPPATIQERRMALSAHEKKLLVLARLTENDRIVRQRPDGSILLDAAWFLQRPQSSVWISTVKWLERNGMIAESIAPVEDSGKRAPYGTDDEMRAYYQSELRHRVYGVTRKGVAFLDAHLLSMAS